jgi:hypothetical protein
MPASVIVRILDLLDGDHETQRLVDPKVLQMAYVDFRHTKQTRLFSFFPEGLPIFGPEALHADTQLPESLRLPAAIPEDLELDLVSCLSVVDLPLVDFLVYALAKLVDVHTVLSLELPLVRFAGVEVHEEVVLLGGVLLLLPFGLLADHVVDGALGDFFALVGCWGSWATSLFGVVQGLDVLDSGYFVEVTNARLFDQHHLEVVGAVN